LCLWQKCSIPKWMEVLFAVVASIIFAITRGIYNFSYLFTNWVGYSLVVPSFFCWCCLF
jgi:hypothetical protein